MLSRKVLSLTKPKGKIYKTKFLGHYITIGEVIASFEEERITITSKQDHLNPPLQLITYQKLVLWLTYKPMNIDKITSQVLEATPHKAAAVRPLTSHHENYQS